MERPRGRRGQRRQRRDRSTYPFAGPNIIDDQHSITVSDLNNDGKNDLIGRKVNGDIWFTPNVGGGNGITWGSGWLVMGGSGFTQAAVGDLNNDMSFEGEGPGSKRATQRPK
jgi:hypothetical protein